MSVLTEPPVGSSGTNSAHNGSSGPDATGQDTASTDRPAGDAGNGLAPALETANGGGLRARLRRSPLTRSSLHDPDLNLSFPIQNSQGPGSAHRRTLSDQVNRISWPNPFQVGTPDFSSSSSPHSASIDFSSYNSFAQGLLNRDSARASSTRRHEPHQHPSQSQQMLFTHSASFSSPAPPAGLTTASSTTTTTTTTTPSGTSPPNESASRRRLRRLSHLRSYNPSHLLSRDSNSSTSGGEGITRSASDFNNVAAVPRTPQQVAGTNSRAANRLTLVNSAPVPSRAATANNTNNSNHQNSSAESQTATNDHETKTAPPSQTVNARQGSPSLGIPNSIQEISSPIDTTPAGPQLETDCRAQLQPPPAMTRTRSSTTGDVAGAAAAATTAATAADFLPSIRFSAYYDPRSTRPSLTFPAISRTLPTGTESIRVGRYSERDSQNMSNQPGNQPSAAPVGFKSKVVSRRHCEFWYENGKWYIKDVKSSSGTFLNHIRLSPPSSESKAFVVGDGDIVQLGIDFKGGEEMIFRCVKMRVELNRGWQNKLNTFK